MNSRKWLLLIVALGLMAGSAGWLARFSGKQKLGLPGVKTGAVPTGGPEDNGKRVRVQLPEHVLDYESEWADVDDVTLGTLPQDTSFGARRYKGPDGFQVLLNVVLMGGDRTSLHKPQFCLEGQGWNIDQGASTNAVVRLALPGAAAAGDDSRLSESDLPVVELLANKEVMADGQQTRARGIYVYWYVAGGGVVSAGTTGFQRMWWMSRELFRTGVLQRWAYVSAFSVCAPGQEEATFERMKKFIAAAAPEFQQAPKAYQAAAASAKR
jgi:hypothetical protein